jgi:hypothetical protein
VDLGYPGSGFAVSGCGLCGRDGMPWPRRTSSIAFMNGIVRSISGPWPALALLVVCSAGGCTSAISTAYLRDTLWDTADHAAESESSASDALQDAVAEDVASDTPVAAESDALDDERRAAAIDEAVQRLARLGNLDEATRNTLMETLQRTQQEDWPVVVEAFAASLESSGDTPRGAAEAVVERASSSVRPASHVVAKADLDEAAGQSPVPPTPPAAGEPAAVAPAPPEPESAAVAAEPVSLPPSPAVEPPAEPAPSLAVRNACFASRVQAWGLVDRFAESRFRPGQELIVYFELDNLSAGESPAGHTTCIDTTLTLVDRDGRTLHDWSFEPIAETCRAKRHDYFARYVIRIPEAVSAGECRIDVVVVDTLAGTTARASLPLGIVD